MASKMVCFAIGATALLCLAGCVSAEELRAHDVATCTGYGFQQGSPEFAACLQRENLARQYYWSSPYPYGAFYGPYPYSGGSANIFMGF